MLIGENAEKLRKLTESGYIDNDNYEEVVLLEGAPADIVELFEWYMGILKEEERTGKSII